MKSISLKPTSFGIHSMRRTQETDINRKTGSLRVVLLLGHTKMDSTERYLGVWLQDTLAFAEAMENKKLGPVNLIDVIDHNSMTIHNAASENTLVSCSSLSAQNRHSFKSQRTPVLNPLETDAS